MVARLFKVKVLKFAIGFGPKVFTKVSKETEYTIRLIPFGGFVQMEGEEHRSEDENAFNKKPIWQRILVVLAGPLVNIIFALIVYCIVVLCLNQYESTIVKQMDSSDLAYAYGFREGDKIVSVNRHKTTFGWQVDEEVSNSKVDDFLFVVLRDGQKIEIPAHIENEKRGLLGVAFSGDRSVAYVYDSFPVGQSGIQVGDVVIAINGTTVYDVTEIINTIRNLPEQSINITVLRGMDTITYTTMTTVSESRVLDITYQIVKPGFWRGLRYALADTKWYLGANLKAYGRLFVGETENVEVMGVVGIAGEITKTSAVSDFFTLMCAISLSLGIFNLLPIPALDGGRILLLLIEAIRRKPLSEKIEQGVIVVSFFIIILFAIVVTFFDISKLFGN